MQMISSSSDSTMVSFEEDFEDSVFPFGGQGDGPIPSGASCAKISDILDFAGTGNMTAECSFGGEAKSLPAAVGLYVDGMGDISVPLIPEQAEKLIEKCEKSSFGHTSNLDMDENTCKIWQLTPDQMKINNSKWNSGIKELLTSIANRFGYENTVLNYELVKLMVYGEGSHLVKYQNPEKEKSVIATLVVQPPSRHEGGNLVVYRDGKQRYRHDFGEADGTAPYSPHYAVHYADAEYALEKVTKGCCLALVYSISLPLEMLEDKRHPDMPTIDDLADAISDMELSKESFALMLDNKYSNSKIMSLGSGALNKTDCKRFQALDEANSALPVDKKLQIFIAKLSHKIISHPSPVDNDWQEYERRQGIHWYTTSGEDLGRSMDRKLTTELNFLNPGQESYTQLWNGRGDEVEEAIDEVPTRIIKYSKYAIVAWPATQHVENALKTMSVELAVEALGDKRPVDGVALHKFLDVASTRLDSGKPSWGRDDKASVRFCRTFCDLLVYAHDVELAKMFFSQFFPRLGMLNENITLAPVLTRVSDIFDWNDIGETMLDVLGNPTEEIQEVDCGVSHLEMTLLIVDNLTDGLAQKALLQLATQLFISEISKISPNAMSILLKHIIQSGKNSNFNSIIRDLETIHPSELGQVIAAYSEYFDDFKGTRETCSALTRIAIRRIEWLNEEIDEFDTIFSWAMPDAKFPIQWIEKFLRGPKVSVKNDKFTSLPEARKWAAECVRENQNGASFTMKPSGKGKGAYVTIKKTRKWFDNHQNELKKYNIELEGLEALYEEKDAGSLKKKLRLE